MHYRRNADQNFRILERRAASGDVEAQRELIAYLFRIGRQPYWIRIREVTCRKDEIYADKELQEEDPSIPRWEERGPSLDRQWQFFLHIPVRDGTEMIVALGEMMAYESPNGAYLQGCVVAVRDWADWDVWSQRESNDENEIARSNMGLARALKSIGGGMAFHYRAHFNTDMPLGWTPAEPLEPIDTLPLNWDPIDHDPDEIRPYNRFAQRFRHGDPLTVIPKEDFLVEDYLFDLFYAWLADTQTEYGSRLREACYPLDYQFPTIYQERHIWLYYWKSVDSAREIVAKPDDYYPDRTVYEVAHRVQWINGDNARFYRWSHDDAHDHEGNRINRLSSSQAVYADQPEEVHIEEQENVRARAQNALQKKLDMMIEVANKWRYNVILVEGEPPPYAAWAYKGNWMAGMQYPLPGYGKENQRIEYF